MKAAFLKKDGVIGVAVLLVYLATLLFTSLISSLEQRAYDAGVKLTSRNIDARIAVIAIDQTSIDNIGRWPWSREIHAQLIDKLAGAGAKVIATSVFFTEPQQDRGLVYIEKLYRLYKEDASAPNSVTWAAMGSVFNEAVVKLNVDQQLASSVAKAGNVILPMLFELGEAQGEPDKPLQPAVRKWELEATGNPTNGWPTSARGATQPLGMIAASAAGIGSESIVPDDDGVVRSIPLAVRYFDQIYPTFPLVAAARSLNLGPKQIKLNLGESISLANVKLPVSADATFRPYFYPNQNGKPAFPVDSFYDVQAGKIPLDKYKGKIVLIGATALGIGSSLVTPISPNEVPVIIAAHTLSSLLQQHYFVSPAWSPLFSLALALLITLYLCLLLPRLKAGPAAMLTSALFLLLLISHFVLMSQSMLWIHLMGPASLLLLGHGLLTTKRYLISEQKEEKSTAESAESNRMLGMAFQGQGQLDMAFEKLSKVPLDDGMMGVLYNLALDFERKRQFNKAEAVYQYMAGHNPKYRDLEAKLKRAHQMSETVMLGGSSGGGVNGSMLLEDGSVEKPMLGRYQVEKELGKGAMGIVYLGKDPKIGRDVAIKTMSLSQEFEADQLDDARQRFFREAETAGRLNHPNIVTIFDAGEEHDLCYIAMEFLKGKDLLAYTKVDHLLPLLDCASIVRQVAEALQYAHVQHVVHRDIKPANIMYEPTEKIVKVTDFGIARITDSSKTRTGMVLGTPSYMSPEQLSGKKIDGRSDLFSLGVMLYQLSTGSLPFTGESMAELMYKIANDAPQDPRLINPQLPPMLAAIIMKALQKDETTRFQTGAHFAAAMAKLEAGLRTREANA
ncbi:CHASE2 domain-containing serine/threonine-protein kinase [Iodobacter fluviatilis]|uniref:non-specific serine/threonine protein kinase n=1 Tax=Iodobacter fluviatilis TaxID=537 RepID=A0A377SUG2_9NEIS|nr:serine/threonine-protein kinase [Iodobacter fluviatilis]TCU88180.1 serine/threonine-protein kinase [Iodobacter fluviatilis]STR45681.1 Serine/threonine-protein kinase PrkC [Iodobacter fluviatilis]